MNPSDVISVNCPCCNKELFRQGLVENSDGQIVWGKIRDGNRIENDQVGSFIKCLHCSIRIEMIDVPAPTGVGLQIAPNQKCR
jgi:hypothetical protein